MSETSDFAKRVREHEALAERGRASAAQRLIDDRVQAERVAAFRQARILRNAQFIGTALEAVWTEAEVQMAREFLALMKSRQYLGAIRLSQGNRSIAAFLIGVGPMRRSLRVDQIGKADNAYLCDDDSLRVDTTNTSGANDHQSMESGFEPGPACLYDDENGVPIPPITGTFSVRQETVTGRFVHGGSYTGGSYYEMYIDHIRVLNPVSLDKVLLDIATGSGPRELPKLRSVRTDNRPISD